MYSLEVHAAMIMDRVRMTAFLAALRQRVRPGCTVVDLGSGSGVFAIEACRLGARHVWAIEPDDVIEVARRNAESCGVSDRITFIQARGQDATIDGLADVIVSDLRGVLPWFDGHLEAVLDARRRFLAPRGTMIGEKDELWVALVSDTSVYASHTMLRADGGTDLPPMRDLLTNQWARASVAPGSLTTRPCRIAEIDYRSFERLDLSASTAMTVERSGEVHGVAVWFDALLAGGIRFSNRPGEPELIYGRTFFPWPEPIELREGEVVEFGITAIPGARDYLWRWQTRAVGRDGATLAEFDQSTFHGMLLEQRHVRAAKASFVPKLGSEGEWDREILSLMNGTSTNEEIARTVEGRFRSFREALDRVATLAARYAR